MMGLHDLQRASLNKLFLLHFVVVSKATSFQLFASIDRYALLSKSVDV
jgi:hypothetical protein